jgi:ABC-2 type transport system ATP-binding protein
MGLIRPTSGSARVFGHDCWADAPAVKSHVGYLPGEIHLPERMSGNEMLDFFGAFRHDNRRRRNALVERFGADLQPRIGQLSKGNRQKLAVVQALMHDAPLLILDEPSSGLDPLMQAEFTEVLEEERERGRTVFLSSHDLSEVERVADRVAIIRQGRIVAIEQVEQLARNRERHMEVVLDAPVPLEQFERVEGVRLVESRRDGLVVDLGVRGSPKALLRLLATLPVSDFTYGPPDLESIFLHYYSDDPNEASGEAAG